MEQLGDSFSSFSSPRGKKILFSSSSFEGEKKKEELSSPSLFLPIQGKLFPSSSARLSHASQPNTPTDLLLFLS